jgi:hypothetical protein
LRAYFASYSTQPRIDCSQVDGRNSPDFQESFSKWPTSSGMLSITNLFGSHRFQITVLTLHRPYGDSIPASFHIPSFRWSKVLLSHDWMPSQVREQVWYVQSHSSRIQEYVIGGHLAASFTSRSLEQVSHLPKHFILNAGKGTTLKRAYHSVIQSRSVDRRICFVKFCHAPPVVDQQGCFIHIKRAGSPRLRHRRRLLRNICSRDLICGDDKVCLGIKLA